MVDSTERDKQEENYKEEKAKRHRLEWEKNNISLKVNFPHFGRGSSFRKGQGKIRQGKRRGEDETRRKARKGKAQDKTRQDKT